MPLPLLASKAGRALGGVALIGLLAAGAVWWRGAKVEAYGAAEYAKGVQDTRDIYEAVVASAQAEQNRETALANERAAQALAEAQEAREAAEKRLADAIAQLDDTRPALSPDAVRLLSGARGDLRAGDAAVP